MWFAVCVTEFIVIFVINAVTITAFVRNRHLRKRSTYLIINLTVADLMMGAVTGPLELYLAKIDPGPGFSWQKISIFICFNVFPVCSLTNLSLIALERLHATLYPFKHCLIGEWVYFKIIICSWLLALTLSSLLAVVDVYEPIAYWYVWTSHIVLSLLHGTNNLLCYYYVKCEKQPSSSPFCSSCLRQKTVSNFIHSYYCLYFDCFPLCYLRGR